MLFPDEAKTEIANAFYDKDISILAKTETLDPEGGVVKTGETIKSTFKGNVRFTTLAKIQAEIGLTDQIDIAITCDPSTDIVVDDLMQYAGREYVATDVLPYDSHILIVGKKWQTSK